MRALVGVSIIAVVLAAASGATASAPLAPDYQCTTAATPVAGATKVMLAGDSITNESAGDYTWRYWFWHDQVDHDSPINLVGDFSDTIDANTLTQGSKAYLDCDFDQDEEARPGLKLFSTATNPASDLFNFDSPTPNNPTNPLYPDYPAPSNSSWIEGAVTKYQPSVVVALIGANDIFRIGEETGTGTTAADHATFVINKLRLFITQARMGNSAVRFVLTTVGNASAQPESNNPYLLYNAMLPDVISSMSTDQSKIVLATLPSWADHSWDGEHPDAYGEVHIAAAIDNAMHSLDPAFAAQPATLATPTIGPEFPAVLSASPAGNNAAGLSWTLPPGTDRTRVYMRDVTDNGAWVEQADLVLASTRATFTSDGTAICGKLDVYPQMPCTSYTASGLSGGKQYEFVLVSGKGHAIVPGLTLGAPATSNVEEITAAGPITLGTVSQATPVVGVHDAAVRWSPLSMATSYQVRWRKSGSTWSTPVSAGAATSKAVTGLTAGQRYGFEVRGLRSGATTGAWSTEQSGTPKAHAIGKPKKPTLKAASGHRIKATWAAVSGASRYLLQRRVAGGAWTSVYVTKPTRTTNKLVKGRKYQFRIRPYDGLVGGTYSPIVTRKAN